MWNNARKASPDIAAAEIITLITPHFASLKKREGRGVDTAIGVTVKAIGDWCSLARLAALRAEVRPADEDLSDDAAFPVISIEEQISDLEALLASPALKVNDKSRMVIATKLAALVEQQEAESQGIAQKIPGSHNGLTVEEIATVDAPSTVSAVAKNLGLGIASTQRKSIFEKHPELALPKKPAYREDNISIMPLKAAVQ
jgi:hypothetical protein